VSGGGMGTHGGKGSAAVLILMQNHEIGPV